MITLDITKKEFKVALNMLADEDENVSVIEKEEIYDKLIDSLCSKEDI